MAQSVTARATYATLRKRAVVSRAQRTVSEHARPHALSRAPSRRPGRAGGGRMALGRTCVHATQQRVQHSLGGARTPRVALACELGAVTATRARRLSNNPADLETKRNRIARTCRIAGTSLAGGAGAPLPHRCRIAAVPAYCGCAHDRGGRAEASLRGARLFAPPGLALSGHAPRHAPRAPERVASSSPRRPRRAPDADTCRRRATDAHDAIRRLRAHGARGLEHTARRGLILDD